VACIASPIWDRAGAWIATISIVIPKSKAAQAQDCYADAARAARIETTLWRTCTRVVRGGPRPWQEGRHRSSRPRQRSPRSRP
jgi:hypothetical protein